MLGPPWLASTSHLGVQLEHRDGALVMDKYGSSIRSRNADAMANCSAPTLANLLVGLLCRLLKTMPADRISRKLVDSTELPQLPNIPTRYTRHPFVSTPPWNRHIGLADRRARWNATGAQRQTLNRN